MEINWEAIGALGETVGAFAVVVTLIYFAVQLRHVTRVTETQGTVASTELFSKWRTTLLENTDIAVALTKANHGLELTDTEITQLNILADEFFVAAGASFAISQHSGSTYEHAGEIRYTMSVLDSNPGLVSEWERIRPMIEMVSPEYVVGLDEQLRRDT